MKATLFLTALLSACSGSGVETPRPTLSALQPLGFRILVDTNQITPAEAAQASHFAADGSWDIPMNSPGPLPASMYATLGPWVVTEDNPSDTSQVDAVAATIGRQPNADMFYIEDGFATPLAPSAIDADAAHVVPGLGPIGTRVVLLTRSYADLRASELDASLLDPNVSGAAFEFDASQWGIYQAQAFDAGCAHIFSLGKDCYLLIPDGNAVSYLADVQAVTTYYRATLRSPRAYVVLASYGRPDNIHYLATAPGDPNAIETVVAWLRVWRARG